MPTVVGETSGGDPIFEVRSVRLVLGSDANHFNRIAACSKCGREMPGAAVLSPGDLDLTPHPVICKECVSAAGRPLFPIEASQPLGPPPAPPIANAPNGSAAGPAVLPSPADARVSALERRLAELSAQLATRPATGAAAVEPATELFADRLSMLERRLDDIAERLTHGADAGRARRQELEERLRRMEVDIEARAGLPERLEQLAGSVGAQRAELEASLERRIDEVQTTVHADLRPAREELGQARDEFRRGIAGLSERLDQLQTQYDAGLAQTRSSSTTLAAELARAETQLTGRVDRLADGILTHRSDLLAIVDARVGDVQAAVGQAFSDKEEASRASDELGRRLDCLTESVERLQTGLDAELTRVESNLVRVDARLSDRLRALAEGVVAQRSELEVVLAALVEEAQTGLEAGAENMATQAAALARAQDELVRVEKHLNERLDGLEDRAARAGPDVARLTQALEAQGAGFRGQLDDGLAEVRAAVDASIGAGADRLQALEERAAQAAAQLSEIDELLGVLDAGFGELRSGLQEVRDAADVRAELAAHEEALAKLGRSVETLRRKIRSTTLAAGASPRKN